ncbi:MAG: hypothetical protein KH009_08875 [Clostridiales bacterium]|nr:hypothetical protein [Clostridiales bacterium]
MDQNRAAGPQSGTPEAFEQALKQYTQELMALYRRQRAEQQPADAGTQAAERTPEPPSPPKEEEPAPGTRPAAIREPEREPPPAEPEPHTTAGQPHTQTRLRPEPETRPAQSGSSTGEPSRPAMPGNQTEGTPPAAPSAAPENRPSREERNAAPDASGSPIDAIGREESAYSADSEATLARLREGVEGLFRDSRAALEELETKAPREEQNAAPDASSSPIDAIGREESTYSADSEATLARLREGVEGLFRGSRAALEELKAQANREEQNAAPDASGSPIDAIGREESAYCAICDETLARLREGVEGLFRGSRAALEELETKTPREEQNAAPDASGSPIDAIGREEATYCALCDETLARLREGVEALGDRLREGAESLLRGRQQTGDSREDRSIWEQPAAPAYSPVTGPADSGAISEAETAAGLLPYDTTTFAGSQASGGSSSAASSGSSAGEEGPQGTIKTQVFTARRAYPVKGAQVDLYQDREGRTVLLDSQLTDQSGQTEPVTVPALNKSLSEQPGAEHPYLSYHLHISHPDFVDAVIDHVAVFEDVVSIQSVDLIPTAAAPTPTSRFIEYPTPEEELL